ncbi:ATP-binding protein [Pseudomonadota bacterium]
MTFSLTYLFFTCVVYLSLLFLIAYATESGWIPSRVARHPITYVLSLGVYATSWSFYGSVGFAQSEGYLFLTIYIGVTLAFIATPVLLAPILRLVREYQLTSLADLFAFRYRSHAAGVLVTLFMLAGTLPYIALQIRAVTESIRVLTLEAAPTVLALGFCITLITFAILFGARHISPREKHEGLVVAIAFESLVKLIAMISVGVFAVYGVFGGLDNLDHWLTTNPKVIEAMYKPAREGAWTTLLFLAFAAAFLLPRQFHMTFTENMEARTLISASWAFPLFLLLFNLSIPVILWAAQASNVTTSADYYVLGITLNAAPWLTILAFVGGVSAASAMVIVTTLALAAMCLNHLWLPASYPDPTVNLYKRLIWGRRTFIALIIIAGFAFYLMLERNQGLVQLGLISFVAVAQFIPGVVGILYWANANRYGFIAGLLGGATVWMITLILPLIESAAHIETGVNLDQYISFPIGQDKWTYSTFVSLAVNTTLFVLGSLLFRQSSEEAETAQECVRGALATPPEGVVLAESPEQFQQQLAHVLGVDMARTEVDQALGDLGLKQNETNPTNLRRLRDRIERNLSGLMGPQLARMTVNQQLQLDKKAQTAIADSMRFLEERLEVSRTRLRGLVAQLDIMRRYHRQILRDLPIGACSISPNEDIVIWNPAMELISDIDSAVAVGKSVSDLVEPWNSILSSFKNGEERNLYKMHAMIQGRSRWFNLHKAALDASAHIYAGARASLREGTILMVEDLTETHLLEAGLAHSERLASIGRLAAGVAHEIGNPVTGIACLAQNIQAESNDNETQDSVIHILEQTKRINSIVQSLVSFSHGGTQEHNAPAAFDLYESVEEVIQLVRLSHKGKEINYLNQCEPSIQLFGDQPRLLQVFVNILSNACDASQPGDSIEIRAAVIKKCIEIEIEDSGSGIPDDYIDKIFEPFVTTKPPGRGTGLGLALAYTIIKDHGGEIEISSEERRGTKVTIVLPNRGGLEQDSRENMAIL